MSDVFFIGAGPGDPELITLKAVNRIKECKTVIYAGSLVSKDILTHCREDAEIYDSASMNLDEIINIIKTAASKGTKTARLHTGDPSLYGAIKEQMLELDKLGITYEVIPGITALFAAAAALRTELTAPEQSQTVIISRIEGRTPVPDDEKIELLSKHGGTFALYLSVTRLSEVLNRFRANGWSEETPVAVVYRASWQDEKIIRGSFADIEEKYNLSGINKHALIIIGKALSDSLEQYSKLYNKDFSHDYRK
ncbi:precorrin-4 C11-methyltransferase [Denitrovibrio acetiphilus DSM 12809]|uniref:Precorrin-4 C11-methyltransferase n=1 Tax=Denitrovibrio acetiphilus (strain DSM 12809 / NBRC 114555 / N2460) TaxID=522772 RepID=D4H1Y9_DENA2|nr:precorrin-4 C(11)-methyltransferase [Denitrovibrio acetiphilus]ADD66966.1 precorrin-4 C11-methyltransferase [Denitrovibrio acetiphilus DSM 12809]